MQSAAMDLEQRQQLLKASKQPMTPVERECAGATEQRWCGRRGMPSGLVDYIAVVRGQLDGSPITETQTSTEKPQVYVKQFETEHAGSSEDDSDDSLDEYDDVGSDVEDYAEQSERQGRQARKGVVILSQENSERASCGALRRHRARPLEPNQRRFSTET